jgi:hypothetical protein
MMVAGLNISSPVAEASSKSSIPVFAALPAGYGQGHLTEAQHVTDESQVALPPPVPELAPSGGPDVSGGRPRLQPESHSRHRVQRERSFVAHDTGSDV